MRDSVSWHHWDTSSSCTALAASWWYLVVEYMIIISQCEHLAESMLVQICQALGVHTVKDWREQPALDEEIVSSQTARPPLPPTILPAFCQCHATWSLLGTRLGNCCSTRGKNTGLAVWELETCTRPTDPGHGERTLVLQFGNWRPAPARQILGTGRRGGIKMNVVGKYGRCGGMDVVEV